MIDKNAIKPVLIFLAGAAIGSLGTWFGVKKYYENKANKEIEDVKRAFGERLDEIDEENKEKIRMITGKEEIIDSEKYREVPSQEIISDDKEIIRRDEPSLSEVVDYTSYYNFHPMDSDEDEDLQEPEIINETAPVYKKPRLIKQTDYEEMEGCRAIELNYYMADGIVEDTESGDLIDNPEALIGDALVKYGFNTNDESVIFVKNENDNTIYEVYKIFAAYSEGR